MKKSKLFKILLVIFAAFLVCFTNAFAEDEEPVVKTGWTKPEGYCYDKPERLLTIHYIVDGKEVNPGDPNAGSWYSVSSSKKYPCTSYSIPESYYNYNTGFGSSQKMFTNEDGTLGVIYWYNNPELTGKPVTHIYPDDDPDNNDIYLYASTGKIIEVYANGYKKKVVVGKMYSPATMDPDYYVDEGVTHNYSGQSVNYWNYSTEADYFSYATAYAEDNSNPTYTYYRDKTATKGGSTILPAKAQYLHVDNTELVQFINYESCRGNDNYLYCNIAHPETGEAMTDKEVEEMLDDEWAYSTVYIHDYSRIPKYYKYFGFIDTEGREYAQDFEMKEEYAGRAFTTVVDTKMSCATDYISPYHSNSYVAKVYGTNINFDGAEYSGDFNTNYLTKLKTYYGNEYYADNKTNYNFSSCVPYDINFKYTYKISKPNLRRYSVVLEGTEGIKVNQNSIYKLPTEGKPKSSSTKVIKLKFQDGVTPDQSLTYTTTYTPTGFKIDGVHYGFGEEIVVTRDLYITYDYSSETTGPDLPTPTRELFNFKGWYDATIGGHIVTDPKTLSASVLYAQWGDVDKVTIVRPDGIPIELEKGSSYTMPTISDKDEVVNSSVSFNYNDRSGRVDVSKVITYYKKNGIKDILTGDIYQEKETIIVNNNMVLTENYIVNRVPATFPQTPTRKNYDFVGWFDSVEGGQQYTEYNGDQDLSLFARWEGDIEQVTIYFPDGFYVTIDKGESYTLPRIDSINDKYKVTFKYQDGVTADKEQYVVHSYLSNGWIIDGDHYEAGETITPMEDVYLQEDFVEAYSYPTFDAAPDQEWDRFVGWFDAAEGGNQVTSYETLEPATFYAHWEEIPSKDIVLGEVPEKDPTTASTVTFVYNNGNPNTTSTVTKSYTPNGWTVDGVHHNAGDTVTITRNSTKTPDYIETITGATFPENPVNGELPFAGWFDAQENGTLYTSYDGTNDITLYALYKDKEPYELPENDFDKPDDILSTITFKYHNGQPDTTANVTKYYVNKGWLVDGVHYPSGSIIEKGLSSDIKPNFAEFINNADFPENPTKPGYRFAGWYTKENGGERVIILNGEKNMILHAHWTNDYADFLPGPDFNSKFKSMIQGASSNTATFTKASESTYNNYAANLTSSNIASTEDSPNPIYVWRDGLNIYYYSPAEVVYFNANGNDMFKGMSRLKNLDVSEINSSYLTSAAAMFRDLNYMQNLNLNNFDTHNVTDMNNMFYNIAASTYYTQTVDVSKFDTQNVTNMSYMFMYAGMLHTLDVSHFNTSKVTNFSNMFSSLSNGWYLRTVDLSGWDTSSAINFSYMFYYSSIYDLNVSHFNTQNAENMSHMFDVNYRAGSSAPDQELDLSEWDTHNAKNMSYMFQYNTNITALNVSTWDVSNVTNMEYMFSVLNKVTELDLSSWDTSKVTNMGEMFYNVGKAKTIYATNKFTTALTPSGQEMFYGASSLVGQKGTKYNRNNVTKTYAILDDAPDHPGYFTLKEYPEVEDNNKYLVIFPEKTLEITKNTNYTLPANNYAKNSKTHANVTFKYLDGVTSDYATEVSENFIPNGFDINGTHYDDNDVLYVDENKLVLPTYVSVISNAQFPQNPEREDYVFLGWYDDPNYGNIYTSYDQFEDITLYAHWRKTDGDTITLPINDTPKADEKVAKVTFVYHNGLADSVNYVTKSFIPNGWLVDGVHKDNGAQITPTESTVIRPDYREVIRGVQFPENPTMGGYEFVGWFTAESGGTQVTNYNGTSNTTLHAQYTNNYATLLSGRNFNSKLRNFASPMYNSENPDVILTFRKATLAEYNDASSELTSYNIVSDSSSPNYVYLWKSGNDVLYYSEADTIYMDEDCTNMFWAVGLSYIDLSGLNSSKVTTMETMFSGNYGLKSINFANLNTSNVQDFNDMFYECYIPTINMSGINTQSATNMQGMFAYTSKLTSLDISNFDTSNVTDFGGMFMSSNIPSLDVSRFNTSSATTMNGMFYNDENLTTIDVSSFNTSNVTDFGNMFSMLHITSLDLSNFDTRKAQDMSYMFHFTRELETIYVSDKWNTDLVTSSSDMFTYDDSLVGQKGTTYNENHIDKEYARVDDPDNNKPGYLTNKIPDTETYTIIYPDHFVTVPKGTQYTLDENTYTKASDTFDVTFKLLNGQDDIIRTVTKSYLPSGWIIDDEHYNAGDIFVVNKNITIVPDYSSVITPITFPSNPTRTNHSFTGWFDAVYGGNKYTSYAKDEEYTLYAHWNYVGPGGGSPTGDMLCLRATTLHEKECESTGACVNAGYEVGDTITYGNLGTLGTLNVGDAFTCDVNGDGTFDEETERFYYVSDYFNTSTKSFDTDVAALIWYTDTYTSWYAESEDDYTYNYNGPDDIYDDLPSYNYEWPNVRLKKKTRAILADDLADNMNMNKVAYQYYNDWTGSYSNTTHNLPTSFDYDDRSLAARLLTLPEVKSAYGWQYPNTTAYATASLPFMVENTNFASETENYEEYEYGPNGYWLETVQYDSGYNAYYLGSDRLGTEYADYSYGARPVIDVPKEQMEISDVAPGYYKITLPDRIEKVAAGSEFTVPYNTYAKSLVNGAYVNFYSNNGTATNNLPNYTRYVTKSYVANGFDSSDGVHYNDRDTFIVNKDLTLTPNNIEIENGVEFPEDPVKEGYTFDGWFDSNGVQYTEYYGTTNLYLYAQYTLIPPTPGLYTLPTNTKTKANDTYTVTFVYNNGSSNATRTVTVSYTPNGWLVDGVHHDNGETINYEEGMVITEDYTKTVTAATFPSNPSKTGYTFKGWFDVNTQAGGNKYTSYDKEADFTLYARFTIDNPIPEGTKCLRANTLHTGTLNNIPVTFGSLGTDGELNPGDAFTCDINGDGTFDEENERFYYVSDYYDTYTKEFDDDYAVLIWSQSSDESTHYTENRYADETDQYLLSEGPNYARLSLPDNWTNVGLKTSTRHIYAARGNDFNIESDQFEYSYIEYDTHMEPECVWHDAEYEEQECYYDYENQYCYTVPGEYHEGACNNPDDPWDCEPGYNDPDETICDDPEYVCPEPILIHEAGNVCEDVEVQTQTPKTDTYTWDYEENFSYSGYSARFLNAKELSQATGVTNFTRNAQIPISGNEYLLESGTDWFLENPQNMREPWNVTSQGKLYGDIEVDGGVVPAIDVPKENMEVDFLPKMHTITYPDGSTEEIEHGETFIFPNNTYDKGNESVATVTFNYGDGRDNTTSTVQKSFANNGFKVNGTHYDAGDSYIVNSDITLEGDYVETIIGAAFPENVERLAYNFEGWYTAPTEGAKVTSYTTEQDVTLYAHWTENVPTPGTLYTLPENNTPKEGGTYTVVFKFQNGDPDSTRTFTTTYTPYGWKVNGIHKNAGDQILIKKDTVIEPDYVLSTTGDSFPENPGRQDYEFEKWTDAPAGGNVYTLATINKNLTLYAQWKYVGEEHIIPPNTKCIRARKDPLPGNYGTDENTLSAKNAFDCDTNGDGTFDSRFIYVSDLYDTVTGEFDHDYAVLAYDGIVEYYAQYNISNNLNGPTRAMTYMPTTSQWSNFTLKNTTRQIRTIDGNTSSQSTNLPTVSYEGYAARLLTIQEINEGCGLNITTSSLSSYPRLNDQCSFLTGDLIVPNEDEPWMPADEFNMMLENIEDGSNLYLTLDGSLGNFESRNYYDAVRPVIEVPKENLDLAIVPVYYTVTYPNGRVDTVSNRVQYTFAGATETKDSTVVGKVTFKSQNGEADKTSNVLVTYAQDYWKQSDSYINLGAKTYLTQNYNLTASFKETLVPATFPENPTKEGYSFVGWYDAPTGGNVVSSYNSRANKTLYAQYIKVDNEGRITLGKNETPKNNADYINYIFEGYYQYEVMPDEYTTESYTYGSSKSQKAYTPNGWLVDGVHYDDYSQVAVTPTSTIVPDYIETIIPGTFPEGHPESIDEDYTVFIGWSYAGNIVTSLDFVPASGKWAYLEPEYVEDYATLLPGNSFNTKLKSIISASGYTGSNLTFRKATASEYNNVKSTLTSANLVSVDQYDTIYAWVDTTNELVLFYSEYEAIFMNQNASNMFKDIDELKTVDLTGITSIETTNMSSMFEGSNNITSINLTGINTGLVTNMSNMFKDLPNVTSIPVSGINTSRATNLSGMFSGDSKLTSLTLTSFNTSNVTDMSDMFKGDALLTSVNLSSFDVSNVTDMSSMFEGCSSLTTLDLSRFKTDLVTDMSSMFKGDSNLTSIDLHNFETAGVIDMSSMFEGTTSLTSLNISSFNTAALTNTSNMFKGDSNLTTVYVSTEWEEKDISSSTDMFNGATSIVGQEGTVYNANFIDKTYARVDNPDNNKPGYFTLKGIASYGIYIDDNLVQKVTLGEVYVLPQVAAKDSENVSTVTFKYLDNKTADTTANVTKTYTADGYTLDGNKYAAGDAINVEGDMYFTSNYTETITSPTFPTPTRTGYEFIGWIMEENYDQWNTYTTYSSYDGSDDITLYAHWRTKADGTCSVTYADTGVTEVVACDTTITVPMANQYESETLTFTYLKTNNQSSSFNEEYSSLATVTNYKVGDTTYNPGQSITVNGHITITPTYSGFMPDDTAFTVPNDALRFVGWFSAPTGGKQINSYKEYKEEGLTSKNLYGHSNEEGKCSVILDGVEVGTYDCGSTYTLPNGANTEEDVATVTFINGDTTTTSKVHAVKTFENYSVKVGINNDAINQNPAEVVTVSDNTYITSNYDETITPVTISNLSDTDYYTFDGWYTGANGSGAKFTGNYSSKVDLTLYANFVAKKAQYSFYDAVNQSNLGYMEAEYGSQIDTNSIRASVDGISSHSIRYVYNNGTEDFVDRSFELSNEIVSWTQEGTNKPYALVHTVDVVGPISLNAVFGNNKVATNVTLETLSSDTYPGYDFAGWYTLPIGGKVVIASDIKEDKDYVLYAHWTRNNDNICTLDDGTTMLCPQGATLTVPGYSESIVARVNEIVNGTTSQYYDYQYATYEVVKTSYIDYAVVDGVTYYPGDEYTIGVNPQISITYKSSITEPVTLDTNVTADSDWFENGEDMVFTGWFTERDGGDQLFKYSGEENINVYAHYKEYDQSEETYTVSIEGLDGNVITQENVSKNTKIKLYKDTYTNKAHEINLYDSDGTTLIGTTYINFTHEANKYVVNGLLKDVGSEVTITGDTYIKAYETNVVKDVNGYKEPTTSGFIGYFTAVEGGSKVDVELLTESDNTYDKLYAHYHGETPQGYVSVDFDGDIYDVLAGSTVTLPLTKAKENTSFNVKFNFNQGSYEPYTASIITSYSLVGFKVNNQAYNPGDTITANTNLVIRSQYSESKSWDSTTTNSYHPTYPAFPVFTNLVDQPSSWVIDITSGTTIADASTLTENTELYAHYSDYARVYLNDEVIALVKLGTNYTLPLNNYNKASDTIGSVTFVYNNDTEDTTSYVYKVYTPNGWYIENNEYVSGASVTVNADITLVPKYKETITAAKFPKNPTKENATFVGWFTSLDENGEQVTSYNGTDNITLNAKWKNQYKIVDPIAGTTEYVDEGTKITLESLNDKEEKFYDITFNYNYENAPADKVVRISTQELFKGWLINGVLHNAGEEITVEEDITKVPSYEKIINNKNLPNNPTRDGYTFKGWYNSGSELFGSIVDVTKLETNATVYAHWAEFNPETQVTLTWDGVPTVHDMGTVINLEKEGTTTTEDIATVTFIMNKPGVSDKIVKITRTTFVDHLVINGSDHEATGTYTLNRDTIITSVFDTTTTYPQLPVVSDTEFSGFYTAPEGGEKVTTLDGIVEDKVFYAQYNGGGTVPAIIDGEEIEVSENYTVPSLYGDPSTITINLDLNYEGAPSATEMTISTQRKVLSQTIDGITYTPGKVVKIKAGSVITTNLSDEYVTTRTPEYTKPSDVEISGNTHTFQGWYDTNPNEFISVTNLTGNDTEYNNHTLHASWMYKYDNMVILHLINGSEEKYIQLDPGTNVDVSTYVKADTNKSISIPFKDIVKYSETDNAGTINISQAYGAKKVTVNNIPVLTTHTFDISSDTTLEITYGLKGDVTREVNSTNSYNFLLETPPVTLDDVIYKGLYTSNDSAGSYVNILNLTVLDTNYDNNTLYVRYADKDSNTTLTIDGKTTIVAKGDITLPGATTKAAETIKVNYDYNDGTNYTYTQNITKSYTFAHYKLNDNEASITEYAAGSTFNITKPTEFNSVFTESYRYPSKMHTLTEEGFLGWYTAKTGGNKVTTLEGITSDTTLYARWDSSMYYTVPEASGETKSIQVYFDQNYDGAPNKELVTVTSQRAVLYQTVNGVVHNPGDVIRIDGELNIQTVLSDDYVTTFTPVVTDPQDRGNYYFVSWGITDDNAWQDGETINDHLTAFNIDNLAGYKDGYNNLTLYAMWDEHAIINPEDRVMLKVITPTSTSYKEYEKGTDVTVSALAPNEITSSINVGLYDDESSYTANIITTKTLDKVLFNDEVVSYNGTITLNSNGTIEYTYTEGSTVRSGDYPAYVEQKAPYVHDNLVYVGIYESNDNNAKLIDFLGIKGTDLDHKDKNYYIKNNDDSTSENTYLYLDDNDPVQIPMGAWTTPSATTKDSDNIFVTFDYNDNSGRTVQKAIIKAYTFDHFHVDAVGEDQEHDVNAGVSYNVTHYLVMHSVFNSALTYPDMLTISVKEFEGWYTSPTGGTKVTTLDGITEPTTLYAHYTSIPDPTVLTFDGVVYIVPAGIDRINPLNEGYATNQIVKKATLTLVNGDNTETHTYSSTIDHIGWTDENGTEFGETIDLTTDNIGVTFTSRYSYENVDDVDLSKYNPDDDKFEGWFTEAVGGTKQTTYTPVEDETYYAHFYDVSQVTITVDEVSELHAVGSTYTLPDAISKTVPSVVITFDHNDGLGTTTTKSFDTVYTFAGYRLESNNTLYDANAVFNDIQTDMTFTSEFTKSTSTPTWPENPSKENYIFVGWFTSKESGIQVFNYDDISTNTTLYAHYIRNDEDFVTLTNSATGEYIKVLAGSDFVFADSVFNKVVEESLGKGTFKFNASGYPDEVVDFKVTHTPTKYYIGSDSENLIDITTAHKFNADATLTPYYDEASDVDNTNISLGMFDYTISKEDASPVCFSLTNQTDPRDNTPYECYTKYSKDDGNVTLYLHWAPEKAINVTKPDGTVEVFNIYDNYDLGTNNIAAPANITYNVNLIYHDGETANGLVTYSKTYANNGWSVTGSTQTHYDDEASIELVEDIVIEPSYTETESTVTLPTPTKDDFTFVGWNNLETGLGKYYTASDINSVTESGELTLHAVWSHEQTVNITFDTQGGSSVSNPRTIAYDSEIGQLPETEKTGYIFKGWYTDTTYTTIVTETTKFKYDTTLYAKWVEDVTPGPGEVTVTYPDSHVEVVPTGTVIDLGTIAPISKPDYKIATMTFKYQDELTEDAYKYVYKSYTQSGWSITNDYGTENIFGATETYTVNENITILPNYIETSVADNFPESPTRDDYTFTGWTDIDGTSYTSYLGEEDITLYANWTSAGPTDISVESNAIILVKGETKQIEVTTTPANLENVNYTYTVEDEEIVTVSDEGVITAVGAGTTNVTIAVTSDPSVSTTITATVINNRITSSTLTVTEKDLTGEEMRIIIGAEPETMISDFLTNIDNDLEYIKVYDKDDQLISPDNYEDTLITTGSKLKLVINDTEHDNVLVIIRGDVNQDGRVNVKDTTLVTSHIIMKERIEDYRIYAADVVETEGATMENAINVKDKTKISGYVTKKIDSLNEKEGDD